MSLKDASHAHSKPVITYLSRQTAAHRHLREDVHEALVVGLKGLEKEGVAEVNIEEFTDADPKDEQVAKLSRTTVSFLYSHGSIAVLILSFFPADFCQSSRQRIDESHLDDPRCARPFDRV